MSTPKTRQSASSITFFAALPKDGSGYNHLTIIPPNGTQGDALYWSTNPSDDASGIYMKWNMVPGASMTKLNVVQMAQFASNWKASTEYIQCQTGSGDKGTRGRGNNDACPTKAPTKAPKSKAPTKPPTKAPTIAPIVTQATKAPISAPAMASPVAATAPNTAPTSNATPVLAPFAPTTSPTTRGSRRCGLFRLGLVCLNGCGIIGRILGLCD